jgi:hypothetical protein
MCLGLFRKKKKKKKDMSWFVGFANRITNFTNIQITPPKFV